MCVYIRGTVDSLTKSYMCPSVPPRCAQAPFQSVPAAALSVGESGGGHGQGPPGLCIYVCMFVCQWFLNLFPVCANSLQQAVLASPPPFMCLSLLAFFSYFCINSSLIIASAIV